MKKLIFILSMGLLFSCNNNSKTENTESTSVDSTSADTMQSTPPVSSGMDSTVTSGSGNMSGSDTATMRRDSATANPNRR